MQTNKTTVFSTFWQGFCRVVVKVFYRRFEVSGAKDLPTDRGIILCANHVNALADPIIVQAASHRMIRPMARSGLFDNPFLKPLLAGMGAVPIFRPGDKGSKVSQNLDSFTSCYEMLEKNQVLIIFPEGQSHSDSYLHRLKSGAARLAQGAMENNPEAPAVIPVGLNFSRKGRFRGDVLVNYGEPIDLEFDESLTDKQMLRQINQRITASLSAVTLNADSWQDVDLVRRLERFFALRHGKFRQQTKQKLSQRFQALQRLIDGQQLLLEHEPEMVKTVVNKLHHFERLCQRCGIKDYHLTLSYQPGWVLWNFVRMIIALLVGLPLMLFGLINGVAPYLSTRFLAKKLAKGQDQYDTAKILIGLPMFILFWGLQLYVVKANWGWQWTLLYLLALFISAAVALRMRGRYGRIAEDIKVFFMFMRKRELQEHLQVKRRELEVELAKLVRMAKRLSSKVA